MHWLYFNKIHPCCQPLKIYRFFYAQDLKFVTKIIDKENILPWQKKDGQLLEAEILMNLSHVNIITCVDLYQNTEYIHIVMEYCQGKTLFDIVEQLSRIPETKARRLFQQVQRYKILIVKPDLSISKSQKYHKVSSLRLLLLSLICT